MDVWQLFSDRLLQNSEGNGDSLQIFGTSSDMDINRFKSGIIDHGSLYGRRATSMKGILILQPWLQTVFLRPESWFIMRAFSPGSTTQMQLDRAASPTPPSMKRLLNLWVIKNDYILIQMMQEKCTKFVAGYKLTDIILGNGCFSQVFKAYSSQKHRLAVKVIPRSHIPQSDVLGFQSEVGILRSLKHENIVELIDFKKSSNNFYLFLEYCEGGNLAELIQRRRRLPESEAIKIFGQIVRGISTMHQFKVMHRDLKPSNILLHHGRVKIADFGLATKFSKDQMMRTFAGTPLHMAPQILKGKLYNQKVDIYSAGTVLYEMLYGVMPFKGRDTRSLIEAIERGNPREREAEVSDKTRNILRQMLESEPQNRISLNGLLDFICEYQRQKKQERLQQLRTLCNKNVKNLGAMGALFSNFDTQQNLPSKPSEMDMRLYHKLSHKLGVAQS